MCDVLRSDCNTILRPAAGPLASDCHTGMCNTKITLQLPDPACCSVVVVLQIVEHIVQAFDRALHRIAVIPHYIFCGQEVLVELSYSSLDFSELLSFVVDTFLDAFQLLLFPGQFPHAASYQGFKLCRECLPCLGFDYLDRFIAESDAADIAFLRHVVPLPALVPQLNQRCVVVLYYNTGQDGAVLARDGL